VRIEHTVRNKVIHETGFYGRCVIYGAVLFWMRKIGDWPVVGLVVLVAERLVEGGPVSSRVSAFSEVFGIAEGGSKGTEGGSKPWI